MREIIFDTETTGLDPAQGHRMVEFAAVELVDRMPTGRHWHGYFNPGRPMPPEAEKIHGLTDDFLAGHPGFSDQAEAIIDFIGDAMLVAHNALFDWRFLNAELERCARPPIALERMIDTLELSRKRFPGAKHSLDALCQRLGVDLSRRVKHGALIDAELLAHCYVELSGGRQIGFDLAVPVFAVRPAADRAAIRPPRLFTIAPEEQAAHDSFIGSMRDPVWKRAATG
jgi:DNA polymerase-3 subunit epsilon